MKLYTEEELLKAMSYSRSYDANWVMTENEILKMLSPIELPSDKKINQNAEILYPINKGGSMWMPSRYDISKGNKQEGFIDGAKWMKEQILKQNK
jgi:hypothetical protein